MEVKTCSKCHETKSIEEYQPVHYRQKRKDGSIYKHEYRKNTCKLCTSYIQREYRRKKYENDFNYYKDKGRKEWLKNRDRILFLKREKTKEIRLKVVEFLGGTCMKCGIKDEEVLQVDHILPLNITGKKRIFNDGRYKEVIKNPQEYQLLCSNCHLKKSNKELIEYWRMKRNEMPKVSE